MSVHEYNEIVKFVLQEGYRYVSRGGDQGKVKTLIVSGLHTNESGKKEFKYIWDVEGLHATVLESTSSEERFLKDIAELYGAKKSLAIPGDPCTLVLTRTRPVILKGHNAELYVAQIIVPMENGDIFVMSNVSAVYDSSHRDDLKQYENMYEILKSIRIQDKELTLESVNPEVLYEALQIHSYSDDQLIDTSLTSELTRVAPVPALYPYYIKQLALQKKYEAVSGEFDQVEPDYVFLQFSNLIEEKNRSESETTLYKQILQKDTQRYTLDEKAKEMQRLFRVDTESLELANDREYVLENGLLQRAYMMSGLRSFAWTLSDYCARKGMTPNEVQAADVAKIVTFVKTQNWLNYDDKTYCTGLCSGQDHHVYYVPDGVDQADQKRLAAFVKGEVPGEVRSLDALRNDLTFLYPAVHMLWEQLQQDRDYSKPLLGETADIVYAWCALALAAREPFFSEYGTMNCSFVQSAPNSSLPVLIDLDEDLSQSELREEARKVQEKKAEEEQSNSEAGVAQTMEEMLAAEVDEDIETGPAPDPYAVNIYILLTHEKMFGCLHRTQKDFLSLYKYSCPLPTNVEIKRIRKEVLTQLDSGADVTPYIKAFRQRTVRERFAVATYSLYYVGEELIGEPDCSKRADWAIENTKEWYWASEAMEVRSLMDAELDKERLRAERRLSDHLDLWKNFEGAKKDLTFFVTNCAEGYTPLNCFSSFRITIGSVLVELCLYRGENSYLVLENHLPWYWNVTTRDVWMAALENAKAVDLRGVDYWRVTPQGVWEMTLKNVEVVNLRDVRCGEDLLSNQIAEQIRKKFPELKKTASTTSREENVHPSSEKDQLDKHLIDLYVILTNEEKLSKLHRSQKEFLRLYRYSLLWFTNTEIIRARKEMLAQMESGVDFAPYREKFKQRSLEDRIALSTLQLYTVDEELDCTKRANWAIENTKEWFREDEAGEVRSRMDTELAKEREAVEKQMGSHVSQWNSFEKVKKDLMLYLSDGNDKDSICKFCGNFQVLIDTSLVEVKLHVDGTCLRSSVENLFPWYWEVTTRDVWETALSNGKFEDLRDVEEPGAKELINQAADQIRAKFPELKVAIPAVFEEKERIYWMRHSASRHTLQVSSQSQAKEGCYIATAVYGSYDAPQVLILRRFRDNTLRATALGRWFIRNYYRLSPPVAQRLKNMRRLNALVRALLNRLVWWLDREKPEMKDSSK